MNLTGSDAAPLIFGFIVIFAVLCLFLVLWAKIRKKGGSYTSVIFGATHEFYNADWRKANEVVLEQKTDKKKKEQDDGDDDETDENEPDHQDILEKLYSKASNKKNGRQK